MYEQSQAKKEIIKISKPQIRPRTRDNSMYACSQPGKQETGGKNVLWYYRHQICWRFCLFGVFLAWLLAFFSVLWNLSPLPFPVWVSRPPDSIAKVAVDPPLCVLLSWRRRVHCLQLRGVLESTERRACNEHRALNAGGLRAWSLRVDVREGRCFQSWQTLLWLTSHKEGSNFSR